ncbi:hypothetical protein LIER_22645 [Lithospermum erythrorhizon]|uniref:Uncharacterized protein n=1 Tax=Lithospermum erythrorhizon TaxID=34254 RepID=A0AAV3R0C3_LITER
MHRPCHSNPSSSTQQNDDFESGSTSQSDGSTNSDDDMVDAEDDLNEMESGNVISRGVASDRLVALWSADLISHDKGIQAIFLRPSPSSKICKFYVINV